MIEPLDARKDGPTPGVPFPPSWCIDWHSQPPRVNWMGKVWVFCHLYWRNLKIQLGRKNDG